MGEAARNARLVSAFRGPVKRFRGTYGRRGRAAVQHIVTIAAQQAIVSETAEQSVVSVATGKPIVAFRPVQAVVPVAAFQQARAKGRRVILVTAHFGNYDVVRAHLIARGFTIGALYRKMSNPYFNRHYVRNLQSIGTPVFEQGRRGTMEMVRYLRDGGTLGILTDVHVHGGADLMFFGHPAVTSTVTAELALKYNAILIPIYAIRQPDGFDFEITVQQPITHSDPETMTQDVNDGLEALVRQHMDQWFWIHRRWKPYIVPDQTDV